jgi:hypothetical protein
VPNEPVANPDYWRDRARVTRIKADAVKDRRAKHMLRGIAESYELMAQQLEEPLGEMKK